MEVSKETVEEFQALFAGRTDVWGSVEGKCNKERVTFKHYRAHLEGKTSLGIYPLQDDGTCQFAVIDLDVKDFNKAKAIRQELYNLFIPTYIAESKSKGYHIYCIALEKFKAAEIRQILNGVLNKLNITGEVFPKQDTVDAVTLYGNYINLPCFGYTRQFVTIQARSVPVEEVIQRVKFTPQDAIDKALRIYTGIKPIRAAKAPKGRKKKMPPCIEVILRGVDTPGRDEAAFALARYYLDQNYLTEEVLALLKIWDQRNHPPFNDDHLLQTKVRSAEKGYGFGCKSIKENAMLAGYCVTEERCKWIQEITRERKKLGLIRELSAFETDTHYYEEIYKDKRASFLAYEKATGKIDYTTAIETEEFTIVPILSDEITEGAITLPTGVEEYGTLLDLVDSIKKHILEYDDIPDYFVEFSAWYIVMTWVHDKLSTVSYLRFTGDTGTGKSRSLDVIGKLCYKPMMLSGAVTPAPIYRLIKRFRGTLIMDEADFRDTSEKGEVVIILNCGFERDRPIIRCSKDDPNNLEILPCFGPKVFASRFTFHDVALEARCLTHTMQETDREDIPPLLGETFKNRTGSLRNKLLLWRLQHLHEIDPDAVEDIDLGKLEPRIKQTSLPYAIPFKDHPDILERFKKFLANFQKNLIARRAESETGRIVYALFKLAADPGFGTEFITSGAICKMLNEEFSMEIKAQNVGRALHSLDVHVERHRKEGKLGRYIVWDVVLMRKLLRRYLIETEDFEYLVKGTGTPQNLDVSF